MRKLLGALGVLGTGLYILSVLSFRQADASRNSAGTMSGVNGPYVAGQTVAASLFNNRYSDIETEITNSLDRSGRGGMLAALRGIDGTLAAPALSFTSETGSGLFRNGASDVRMSISGAAKQFWNASGVGFGAASPHSTSPMFSVGAGFSFTAQSRSGVDTRLGSNLYFNGTNDTYNANGFAGYLQMPSQGQDFVFYTAPSGSAAGTATLTERARIKDTGLVIGASGTAISQSNRGTASLTPAAIPIQQCQSQAITVTGSVNGTECAYGIPAAGNPGLSIACASGTNSCTLTLCNPTAGSLTPPAGTYTCRVFNP